MHLDLDFLVVKLARSELFAKCFFGRGAGVGPHQSIEYTFFRGEMRACRNVFAFSFTCLRDCGFDEIAHNKAIDAVYVALPNSMHSEYTIRAAKAGDIVLLAGKGHEKVQVLSDRTILFDDAEVARRVLAQMGFSRSEAAR